MGLQAGGDCVPRVHPPALTPHAGGKQVVTALAQLPQGCPALWWPGARGHCSVSVAVQDGYKYVSATAAGRLAGGSHK